MLARNLEAPNTGRPYKEKTRNAALDFLATFRRTGNEFTLRKDSIGPRELAYAVTNNSFGKFHVYAIDSSKSKTFVRNEGNLSLIDLLVPDNEYIVGIYTGFEFNEDEEHKAIAVCLGEDVLFTIWVDELTETFMIERNPALLADSDIRKMIIEVGVAFRAAL